MAILSKGKTWGPTEQIVTTDVHNLVDAATFASGAVDGSTMELSSGKMAVKDGGVTPAKLSTGAPTWTAAGNFDADVLADNSTTRRALSNRFGEVANVLDFGATGDGTTDDTSAIQAAVDYCTGNNGTLYMPYTTAHYAISSTITVDDPISWICHPLSVIKFSSVTGTDPAILIDYGGASYNLGHFEFGVLTGDESAAHTALAGVGVEIRNEDAVNVFVNYLNFWNKGIRIWAETDTTQNNNIRINVCDDCIIGVELAASASNFCDINHIQFNTIGLATKCINFVESGGGQVDDNVIEGVQAWSEFNSGGVVYVESGAPARNVIDIKYARCESSTQSIAKGATTFSGLCITGTETGVSGSDYFNGDFNVFNMGIIPIDPVLNEPKIKSMGTDNKFNLLRSQTTSTSSAIALSTTAGLANFNGGISVRANTLVCSITIPAGSAGTIEDFYAYMENVNNAYGGPYKVDIISNEEGNFSIYAEDDTATVDYQVNIRAKRLTTLGSPFQVFLLVTPV